MCAFTGNDAEALGASAAASIDKRTTVYSWISMQDHQNVLKFRIYFRL